MSTIPVDTTEDSLRAEEERESLRDSTMVTFRIKIDQVTEAEQPDRAFDADSSRANDHFHSSIPKYFG